MERPAHIQKLFDEVDKAKLGTIEYWILRCHYGEKMHDPTYGEDERRNCRELHWLLKNKLQ